MPFALVCDSVAQDGTCATPEYWGEIELAPQGVITVMDADSLLTATGLVFATALGWAILINLLKRKLT